MQAGRAILALKKLNHKVMLSRDKVTRILLESVKKTDKVQSEI